MKGFRAGLRAGLRADRPKKKKKKLTQREIELLKAKLARERVSEALY